MHQCGVLTCQGITLVTLDGDHALGVRHLQCGIGSMDDHQKLQEKRPPEDVVVPDDEAGHLERQHLLTLVDSCLTGHFQVDASDRCRLLLYDDPLKHIMYRDQVFQIEAHLNEGFPHDKIH
jgi:hypothetical protein